MSNPWKKADPSKPLPPSVRTLSHVSAPKMRNLYEYRGEENWALNKVGRMLNAVRLGSGGRTKSLTKNEYAMLLACSDPAERKAFVADVAASRLKVEG